MKTAFMNQPATYSLSPTPNALRTTRRFTRSATSSSRLSLPSSYGPFRTSYHAFTKPKVAARVVNTAPATASGIATQISNLLK